MRTPRAQLSRRTARRILDGQAPVVGNPVSALLAAVTASNDADPGGEDRAAVAFRKATRLDPVPPAGSVSAMPRIVRKLRGAPVAALAAAAVVVTGGGYALAASQGAAHVPFAGHDSRSSHAPAAPATTNPGLSAASAAASDGADDASDDASDDVESAEPATPETSPSPAATPSPSLSGLCRAFQAGALKDGKSNPAFDALIAAAGGSENLTTFCVDRIGPSKKPTHPAHPSRSSRPGKPTTAAKPSHAAHPGTGKPTAHPSHPAPHGH